MTKIFPNKLKSSFLLKFTLSLVDFADPIPYWGYIAIFIYSQLQIFSIFANTALLTLPLKDDWLKDILTFICQVSAFEKIWNINKEPSITFTVLLLILLFFISEIVSVINLLCTNWTQKNSLPSLTKYWNTVTKLHFYILFYPINVIGIRVLSGSLGIKDEQPRLYSEVFYLVLKIVIILGLIWNFIYVLANLLLFSPRIKTKNPLSTHTNIIDYIDLVIKTISPIIWFFGSENFLVNKMFLPWENLVYSIFRDLALFWFLPYYNIPVLKLSAKIYAFLTIFALGITVSKTLDLNEIQDAGDFAFFVTLLLCPILIATYAKFIQKLLFNILIYSSRMKPYYLVHFWNVWKYFSLSRASTSFYMIHENYLYHNTAAIIHSVSLKKNDSSKMSTPGHKLGDPVYQQIFDTYAELLKSSMQKRSRGKELLRACLARHYLKSEKFYFRVDDLVNEGIIKGSSIPIKVSFHLIRIKLFHKVNKTDKYSRNNEIESKGLLDRSDVLRYIELNELFEDLKRSIGQQLVPQIKFWENYQNQEPDCRLFVQLSKEACEKSLRVREQWLVLKNRLDRQFIEPLLSYGLYLFLMQNDFISGDLLLQEYERIKAKRNEPKGNLDSKINKGFLSDSMLLTVSGSSVSFGKVLDCSNNIQRYLGFSRDMILGQSINLLLPSLLSELSRNHSNNNNTADRIINSSTSMYAVDKEGYLILCWMYITLRFFSNCELCYYLVLSPQKESKRVILIQRSGKVIKFSRNFARDFGISSKTDTNINIFSMCSNLRDLVKHGESRKKLLTRHLVTLAEHVQLDSQDAQEEFKSSRSVCESNNVTSIYKRDRFNTKSTRADNFFTFQIPLRNQKKRASLRSNHPNILFYNVTVENFSLEDEALLLLFLTKVKRSSHYAETRNNDNSSYYSSGESLQNDFEYESGLITQSSKQITTEDIALTPSIRKPKKSRFSQFDPTLQNQIATSEKRQTTSGVGNSDPEEFKPSDLVTTEVNLLNSPVRSTNRFLFESLSPRESSKQFKSSTRAKKRGEMNCIEALKTNPGDLEDLGAQLIDEEAAKPVSTELRQNKSIINKKKYIPKNQKNSETPEERMYKENIKDSSDSFDNKKHGQIYKEIQQRLEDRKHKRRVITYVGLFVFTMIVQLSFLLWLNIRVVGASQGASNLSQTLQAVFLRSHWINLANQETRFWVAIRANLFNDWGLEAETLYINSTFIMLHNQNVELMKSTRYLRPELESLFFEKNVNLYQRNSENKLAFFVQENSFQAVEKIIEHGLQNVYKNPKLPITEIIDEDSRFIFDNSLDDLLIVSEKFIGVLIVEIYHIFAKARMEMMFFLSVSIVLLVFFFMCSLMFVLRSNQETERFFKVFLSLPDLEAKIQTINLTQFYRMVINKSEKKDYFKSDFNQKNIHFDNLQGTKVVRKNASNSSLKKLRFRNHMSIVQISIALLIILALMLIYYLKAKNQITVIEKHQSNINAALENIKLASLISAEIHAVIMENATTTVRHQSILDCVHRDLDNMKGIYDFQQRLTDESGQLPPRQQQILFNLSCNEAYSPSYFLPQELVVDLCFNFSKGSGYVALINILSELSSKHIGYLLDFQNSERTEEALIQLYNKISSTYSGLFDASMIMFFLSFDATIEEFLVLMNKLEYQRTLLAWIAACVLLILVAVLWVFIIKKLIRRIFEPQDVLKMVPPKLIYKNPFLKKYVYNLQ